jgi:hypothetical protein
MKKLFEFLFQPREESQDWTIVRMRAVTQQIGPRYRSGLFVEYREGQ